jgi:hypothetical protein
MAVWGDDVAAVRHGDEQLRVHSAIARSAVLTDEKIVCGWVEVVERVVEPQRLAALLAVHREGTGDGRRRRRRLG